jgi:hypothetical protein
MIASVPTDRVLGLFPRARGQTKWVRAPILLRLKLTR